MRRRWLLAVASLIPLCPTAALGQVSVPLPGGTPSPTPSGAIPSSGAAATVPLPVPAAPRPKINPYNRDIQLTVPLTFRDKILGEMPILLTRDDRVAVYRPTFFGLISKLLNPDGRAKLDAALGTADPFFAEDLAGSGVELHYDPTSLSVAILYIEPAALQAQALFDTPNRDDEKPDLEPAGFAGYLNFNVAQTYAWQSNRPRNGPSMSISGAVRTGGIVLEGSGQLRDQAAGLGTGSGYQFDRDYLRLVYDEPDKYRRWLLGDISPEIRSQQGYTQLGGVGVLRQRRRFNLDRTAVLQGNRQILLQDDSTVSIYRNGVLFKQDRLPAGPYDLSSLPLLAGGNDIRIEVRDNSGRVENIEYESYSDPIDLFPGDYEYSAYVGFIGDRFGGSPNYSDEIAFTGYFRKAFLDKPAVGAGLQLSERVQQLTLQSQLYFWNGSRLQLDGGYSHAEEGGSGFAAAVEFDKTLNRDELVDSFVLRADYRSRRFTGIGVPDPDNVTALNLSAQYTRAFTPSFYVTGTASYIKNRDNRDDSYRVGLTSSYRLDRKWSLRLGVDYASFSYGSARQNGLGGTISLVFLPRPRDRAEARYESGLDTASLSYSHTGSGRIGSVDYGMLAQRDPGSASVEGFAQYTGNRFSASLSQSTYGDGVGSLDDSQVSTLQVGTALAFADGQVALSRRISDSFAILYAHTSLDDHAVVAGQSLDPGDFVSRSGTFGGAVNNYLSSYVDQSITYDVENPPLGYNIGPGVYRVTPPYRSGYAIEVGTGAFVSAFGTLIGLDGRPASLVAGAVVALDDPEAVPVPFFTNSVGRFAIADLRPGGRYRVDLAGGLGSFGVAVPADSSGLLQMNVVRLGGGETR